MYGVKQIFGLYHIIRDGESTGEVYETYTEAARVAADKQIAASTPVTRPARRLGAEREQVNQWGWTVSKRKGLR